MMAGSQLKILLAGGASGGHVFPALAVGEVIHRRGGTVEFVGSPDRMEARIVPERGIPFHGLPARPLVGRGLGSRLAALLTLSSASLRARSLLRRLRPAAMLATGGYVSAAPVLGARTSGVPVLLLEPNVEPGLANRLLSRVSQGACVAFSEAGQALHCPVRLTGVPVREPFFAVPGALPPDPPWRLFLLGGSQGSEELNRLLPEALAALPESPPIRVLHQAGPDHVDSTRARYRELAPESIDLRVVDFLDDPAAALADSHLAVARAGAVTLAELCAAGRGSILVPLALAGGHQKANANRLERSGAARVVGGSPDPAAALADLLRELLGNRERLESMGRAARSLARRDSAERIADRLEELAA